MQCTALILLMMSLFLLLLPSVTIAQTSPTTSSAKDVVCQLRNDGLSDVNVYAAPDRDAAIIGRIISDVAYESDGFMRLANEVWFAAVAYEGNVGETGFVSRRDVAVTAKCLPVALPGIAVPMPVALLSAPLLAYASNRSSDYEMYLWDGEQSINISLSSGANVGQPVWNNYGELAWFAHAIETGNGDIYIWDGYQTINLDDLLGKDLAPSGLPAWSVDGRLAWAGGSFENKEIYIWDGQQVTNISQNQTRDVQPTWSADGRLAWVSDRGGNSEIYVWDGQQVTNISQNPYGDDLSPNWSVDGKMLAWNGVKDGNLEVLVWNGETIINVSDDDAWDAWHVWAPDGRLAWVSTRDESGTVYVWDGESIFRVGEVDANETNLAWSFDGLLAWQSERKRSYDIAIWDGEQIIKFTQSPEESDYSPQWNADGWLAWIVDTGSNWNIHVWDGKQVTNISQNTAVDRYHTWAP